MAYYLKERIDVKTFLSEQHWFYFTESFQSMIYGNYVRIFKIEKWCGDEIRWINEGFLIVDHGEFLILLRDNEGKPLDFRSWFDSGNKERVLTSECKCLKRDAWKFFNYHLDSGVRKVRLADLHDIYFTPSGAIIDSISAMMPLHQIINEDLD